MNKIKTTYLFFLFFQCIQSTHCAQKYVIGNHGGGFFSSFLGVLNNLSWCYRTNRIPVVRWSSEMLYYEPSGYNNSYNAWDYYFQPVSTLSYEINDPIHHNYLSPDNLEVVPGWTIPDQKLRKHINTVLIKKYIKLNPFVEKKINDFFIEKMQGKKTIGIHLRGTDGHTDIKRVPLQKILSAANYYAKINNCTQFFIATDEQKLLNQAIELLQGEVIFYNSYRSIDGKPVHIGHKNFSKARLGEEVLIEAQLLAHCDLFIHTLSNVPVAVLLFNPELEHIYFQS